MSLDFTRVRCRICLETTESYFSMHKSVAIGVDDVLMSTILIYCGNVEVSHDDRKPQNACFTCIENAKVAYSFKMMCMQSESTLNTEIYNDTIIECDPLEFNNEENNVEMNAVEVHYIKEEQPNFNNAEVCSEKSDDESFNYQEEGSNDSFEDIDEQKETKKTVHNCSDCGKNFPNRTQMLKHACTHAKLRQCSYCDFKATTRDLGWHVIKMHDDRKTIKCNHCDKRFCKQQSLKRHMRNHMDIKNQVCGVCGKVLKWEVTLREHMLRHTGEPLYPCTLCDKKFYRKSDLNAHMNIHTKQQVFKCDVCDKEFYRNSDLQKHLKRHKGKEGPYVCEVCKKMYTHAKSFQKHMMLHDPDTC